LDDAGKRFAGMRAELIQHSRLMDAGNGAKRRTAFGFRRFANQVFPCVLFQRNGRISALLGTVVHQSFLANVQEPAAGRTMPRIGKTPNGVVLEGIEMREREQARF
jgi:hypothetical protein